MVKMGGYCYGALDKSHRSKFKLNFFAIELGSDQNDRYMRYIWNGYFGGTVTR